MIEAAPGSGSPIGVWVCAAILSIALAWLPGADAAEVERHLEGLNAADIFPGADAFGGVSEDGTIVSVQSAGKPVGYVFLNSDHAAAVGYSGRPIHILVALDENAVVRGARLVEHHEPIVLIGIPEARMLKVIEGYTGLEVAGLVGATPASHELDIVSGATVTIMVIDDSIVRSSIAVARRLGLGGLNAPAARDQRPPAKLRPVTGPAPDWIELIAEGGVGRLKLTIGDVNQAFANSNDPVAAERPEPGQPDEVFIDLYAALASVESIGTSLLGEAEYANLSAALDDGQHAILLAGRGRFSFKGSGYVRGGLFDRFQLIQGDRSVRFRDLDHERLRRVAADGAPEFTEVDRFVIPTDAGFDPTEPWRIELLVSRETGPRDKAYLTFELDYALPERYIDRPAPPVPVSPGVAAAPVSSDPPLWHRLWIQKRVEIAVIVVALAILSAIFFFQEALVRRPRLTRWVRTGFLLFTVFGIGFWANAQLSVVNILAVFNALITGFDWSYFLMEPLIFILWGSVAVALVLWGRGAFCGWLCPFGAMQELTNRLARRLRVPQWPVPWALHQRLWALKYIIFLALFGVSLHSLDLAERLAEVEPFKTAVVLRFMREWPFVLFAGALLLVGLFVERFYCRYLCALGAALAIPGRMRTFDWLKRYRQCGNPCQRCANDCMVQAIHPEGQIDPNECLYCLHCQELYFDDHRCPVVIAKREKRERRVARATPQTSERITNLLDEIRKGRAEREARDA